MKGSWEYKHVQREDHVKTREEGDHLQDMEKGFRMEITLTTPEINFYCLSHPICGMLLWQPLQLVHTNSQRSYQLRAAFFFFFWLGNMVSVLEGYFKIVPVKKNPSFDTVDLFKKSLLQMKRSSFCCLDMMITEYISLIVLTSKLALAHTWTQHLWCRLSGRQQSQKIPKFYFIGCFQLTVIPVKTQKFL